MMKKPWWASACLLLLLSACSTEETTVGIARNPLLQFVTDSITWQADRYFFGSPSQVVAYPADSSLPGRVYNRYTLNAYGKSSTNSNLQLILMFDAEDPTQLAGSYTPHYTTSRGLAQVQLFNLDNNSLAVYALSTADTTAQLNIQRQSASQRLMAGNFRMTLYNTRDTTQQIKITNGTFTDISY